MIINKVQYEILKHVEQGSQDNEGPAIDSLKRMGFIDAEGKLTRMGMLQLCFMRRKPPPPAM